MKRSNINILIIANLLVLFFILFLIPTKVQAQYIEEIRVAQGIIDPGDFEPDPPTQSDIQPVVDKANVIIGAIRTIGVVVTMIVLMIMGIKYMTGSVSEKAEYKKTMLPYFIGALIFFGLSQLLAIIIEVAQGI